MDNFGDHMVAVAARRLLTPLLLVDYTVSRRVEVARLAAGRPDLFRTTCLGGGALIFGDIHRGWGAALTHALARGETGFTFGTGVIDPAFREEMHRDFAYTPLSTESVARWIDVLSRFPCVGVRGEDSRRILAARGIDHAEVCGDPSLYFARPAIVPKLHARRIGVNVATSSFFYANANASVVSRLATVVRRLRQTGWEVTLFPMGPEDLPPTWELRELAGDAAIAIQRFRDGIEPVLDAIAAQDVFIGVRLHSVTAAVMTYTPAIMLGYQPKNLEFMESVGLGDFHLRIDRLDPPAVIDWIEDIYTRLPAIQDRQFAGAQALRRKLLSYRDRVLAVIGLPDDSRPEVAPASTSTPYHVENAQHPTPASALAGRHGDRP
jgi:hypothetical protein